MPRGLTGLFAALALGCLLLLPSNVVAQSPSAPASPSSSAEPSGSLDPVPGVRPDWTLEVSEVPPFSVQLPPGWSRGDAAAGLIATSETGDQLALTAAPLPAETEFDAWVSRVEADLESAAQLDLPTVFREAGTGLIARIDLGAAPDAPDGATTTRFLFPFCADGTRVLDITGPAPAPTVTGQPDLRDEIASGVDPCAVEPAPERTLDTEIVAAAASYAALATAANDAITEAYLPLRRDATLKVWHRQARIIAGIEDRLSADLATATWPAGIQPLVDTLVARHQDAAQLWGQRFAKARNTRAITSRFDDLELISGAVGAASRDVRLALGLPTIAR